MYQKVMVPLDGSDLAECVLPHVKDFIKSSLAKTVVFVMVVEPLPLLLYGESVEAFPVSTYGESYAAKLEQAKYGCGKKICSGGIFKEGKQLFE